MSKTYPWLAHYPDDIDWYAQISPQPLTKLLDESVTYYPDHIALDFKGKLYSYSELGHKVERFAAGLQKLGVKKGSKIGLFMPNCPQFVIAYYAILKAGGIVVNYNPLYSPKELEHQLRDSQTEIMVTLNLTMLYSKLQPFLGKHQLRHIIVGDLTNVLPAHKAALYRVLKFKDRATIEKSSSHSSFKMLLESDTPLQPVECDPEEDIAVLQYTGGTTGTPKGVMLTHANLTANAHMCRLWFSKARMGEEIMMGVLPFFHVFAMTVIMNFGLAIGGRIILHPRFEMKAVLKDIATKKPTLMPGVPTMFTAICNTANLAKYDLSSLQMCISGGAGLPVHIKQQFEALTGCKLVEGYGLSETSPVVACNPLYGVNKEGSIGVPFPRTVIEIVDKDNELTPMPAGEIGELCVSGPQVMRGYWHNDSETGYILRDKRIYTGDIGYMDEEGYIFIVDRKKEMILSGGYNIYPRNIEEVLYAHEAVLECAVIGIKDELRGEVPKAFIVLKEGFKKEDIDFRAYLKQFLSAYCIPAHIVFRDELPKSLIGKILKKELQ